MNLFSRAALAAAAPFRSRGPGRPRHAPQRDTAIYPRLVLPGQIGPNKDQPTWKPTPRNLRFFSRTPYARRAINAIKSPISMLDWEVIPIDEKTGWNSELKRQAAIATFCFQQPNLWDSWRSLCEQVVEDVLTGAGAMETRLGGDAARPLWLWPVDGLSVQLYPGWDGSPNKPRYMQVIGYGSLTPNTGNGINLNDDELLYLRPNPSTASPFGMGPLEVAFESISRQLGAAEFAGNLATNARPSSIISLGEGVSQDNVAAFRSYWKHDVEGQGGTPIIGGQKNPSILSLHADGDEALHLEWLNFLKREIATAFDLSPQNLGVEADVNRNTSETAEDRDWDQAIKPWAHLISDEITRHCINRLLGFSQLKFAFKGLDREDEQATAEIAEIYLQNNVATPNEVRRRLGWEPIDSPSADMLLCDITQSQAEATTKLTASLTTQDGTGTGPTPGSRQKSRLGKRQSKEK